MERLGEIMYYPPFKLEPNRCNCHPETCCCDDWKITDSKNNKVVTFHNKENAESFVQYLNEKETNE